jgi:hypothetical protein
VPGTRDRTHRGYPVRENPWLQLITGEATRLTNVAPSLLRSPAGKSVTVPIRLEHGTVFSVQHYFCSIRGNAILDFPPASPGANL